MLNQQQANVQNWLAAVQANDRARIAAEQQAQQAAAELTRINEQARLAALAAEAQCRQMIEEAARRERELEEIRIREQARLAALAQRIYQNILRGRD
ncbi:hypothetical protein [Pseudomonas sp. NPDC089534]|uniref:hypothetical protein n=1 Tax=Pseudomonas sp. NPDC089534 TaxID=3364468 RepID=UPI003828089C